MNRHRVFPTPRMPQQLPPALRAFRPKLPPRQKQDLALVHIQHLDAISKGEGTLDNLYQWTGGVLTWSRVVELLGAGVDDMRAQLDLATRLLDRYRATGRVLFTGPEYQLAKDGVDLMDALASVVDLVNANAAAHWSEARLATIFQPEGATP